METISIKSISIKNFRSIRSETINAKKLNIFVGMNDAGKSNVLKALNLFFNGETDYGEQFNFRNDFSLDFPQQGHNTKEIVIEVKFYVPEEYKNSGIYSWKKAWRIQSTGTSPFSDIILDSNKNEPSARSRIPGALRKIIYRYVPAVKSKTYYNSLLGDLYIAISNALESPISDSATGFANALKDYTSGISENVATRLRIKSHLTVPNNMNNIFQSLVFDTYNEEMGIHVPLSHRGDGIQARHIPIILDYIAKENQKSRNQGSMKIFTIWGFEELENGIELGACFELAREFKEYSQEIQIFTTTHSPAFYLQKNDENTMVLYVAKKNGTNQTELLTEECNVLESKMGLMPIIAPFVEEQEKRFKDLKEAYHTNVLIDKPTIFVEGETDKLYLDLAIDLFSPILKSKIDTEELRIVYKIDGAGCKKMSDWILCWCLTGFKSRLLAVYDKDKAGIKSRSELVNDPLYLDHLNEVKVKANFIPPTEDMKKIYQSGVINYEYEIEHLLSTAFLKKVNNNLQTRSVDDLNRMFSSKLSIDKSLTNIIDECVLDSEIKEYLILKEPNADSKKAIYNILKNSSSPRDYMDGFKPLIKMIEEFFI